MYPGECFVGDARHRIHTVLGSCVSVTLWYPMRRIGAMSHFLLPNRAGPIKKLDSHYGEESMWLMLRELMRSEINPTECQAKIFGGGNMFPQQIRGLMPNVGQKNGEIARHLLDAYRIPILCENLFGIGHRQIHFNVNNGNVWARQVEMVELDASKMREIV